MSYLANDVKIPGAILGDGWTEVNLWYVRGVAESYDGKPMLFFPTKETAEAYARTVHLGPGHVWMATFRRDDG